MERLLFEGSPDVGIGEVQLTGTQPGSSSNRRVLALINGIGADNNDWGDFPDALAAEGIGCALVDLSTITTHGYPSMHNYADDFIHTLDSLDSLKGISVDLLGVSWGGGLAQEIALRHPNRIGNLVLAATMPGWTSVPPSITAMRVLATSDRSSDSYFSRAGDVYGGDIRHHPELIGNISLNREVDREAYKRQQHAITRWWGHTLHRVAGIKNRTLVMGGADDPIAHVINSKLLFDVIPNSSLHIVGKDEGGGHLFLHTRPIESARVIKEFLDGENDAPRLLNPRSIAALMRFTSRSMNLTSLYT
jgi:pimeloyl-ACP methyl ester carboxylesterase